MRSLRQILLVVEMNLRNLPQRLGASLVIIIGIAGSVGVLISILAMAEGYARATDGGGRSDRAFILAKGAPGETLSMIPRDALPGIMNAPGIARDSQGRPIAQAEILTQIQVSKPGGRGMVNLRLRGTDTRVFELRPELHLTAGRMFQPGIHELIVGRAAQSRYAGLAIGDHLSFQHGDWLIVGVFAGAQPNLLESELFTDTQTLLSVYQRNGVQSITARLTGSKSLERLKAAVASDRTLRVDVQRESEYTGKQASGMRAVLDTLAAFVGGTLAVGALFGALNSLYTAVSARTLEIAQLRAFGFGATPVVISVLCEALLLSLIGATLAALIAWVLFSGHITSMGQFFYGQGGETAFRMQVTPTLIAIGLLWGCFIGLAGGLLPAIHAARLPVARALNAGAWAP